MIYPNNPNYWNLATLFGQIESDNSTTYYSSNAKKFLQPLKSKQIIMYVLQSGRPNPLLPACIKYKQRASSLAALLSIMKQMIFWATYRLRY